MKSFHYHETAGHPGEIGTYNAVQQHYWWPGLRTFVNTYQDVAPASSSKLTDPQQNWHTSLLKERNQQGHLLIVLWI